MDASYPFPAMTIQELMCAPSESIPAFLIRLRKELRQSQNSLAAEVLSFSPVDESKDLEHWEAKIQGPMGTPYENGIFVLDIHVTSAYPFQPPKIKFKTKVFHPNISSKGEICLDILHDQWAVSLTIEKVLLSIVVLLSDPNIDDFLVPEAAFLYKENRKEYNRKARELTKIYATAISVPDTAQKNLNELNDDNNTVVRDNKMPSLSSNQIVQQKIVGNQPSERRRSARFNVVEPLQAKTFDNGESKECVPIIAQSLRPKDGLQKREKHDMYDFDDGMYDFDDGMYDFHGIREKWDINSELQSLAIALKREGIQIKKQQESEILINKLDTLTYSTLDKVGEGCLHLYSMETFLYRKFNEFLREADNTKIETYGPFVRLLYFTFDRLSSMEVHSIEVYRGMNLSSSMIDSYKEAMKSGISFRWTGFSSTSKSRLFAEHFDTNTLFVMALKKIYLQEKKAIDISDYSQFPEEEEVLLKSGIEFTVEKVNYDNEKKKHYIHLNVYV